MAQATESRGVERHAFIKSFHGIRYQVKDVARAVAFYTQRLGFNLETPATPGIRERVAWWGADPAQRPRCIRFAADAER